MQNDDIQKHRKKISQKKEELLRELGATPEELLQLLRDEGKVPKALYALLQQQRQRVEETLVRCIDLAKGTVKKNDPYSAMHAGRHWIYIR